MALAALLPAWIGLLGDWNWRFDLLSHFRWQYLVVSVVVAAVALWRRQRWIAAFALFTLATNAFLIGRLAWDQGLDQDRPAGNFTLRVLAFNVLTDNPGKQGVLDSLMASDADVIFLMEVNAAWMAALTALETKYPHHLAHPREDNFGLALFSRVPLSKAQLIWPGDSGLPSVEARIVHQGRELVLIGTHPMPPVGARHAALRDAQLEALARHVSATSWPVLVVGDLNATPWSAGTRRLTSGRLGFRSHDPPWKPTWKAASIFAIPIDHALVTAPLVIATRSVGPDLGSDHRPLHITVGWEP